VPDGSIILSGNKIGRPNTWRWSKEKVAWGIENDFIVFKQTKDKWKAYIKQYQFVDNENKRRERKLPHRAILNFLNAEGSKELNNIVKQSAFRFPKPTGLVLFCIHLFENKNITILDFFAGSGTTGHATLMANAEDGGNRKFIICTNNENNICETVTYPRIKNAIKGYEHNDKKIKGLGGSLTYYKTSFEK
jgi:adenine-specific DNA-methyltransferase